MCDLTDADMSRAYEAWQRDHPEEEAPPLPPVLPGEMMPALDQPKRLWRVRAWLPGAAVPEAVIASFTAEEALQVIVAQLTADGWPVRAARWSVTLYETPEVSP